MTRSASNALLLTAGCLAAGSLLFGRPAGAEEAILRFHSHIVVREDGGMTVQETIAVRSEAEQIRRGIYRDFPTTYTDHQGRRYVVGFSVTEVRRDGVPEPYRVEPQANGQRVYIGHPDVYLPAGRYTYTLTYDTTRQLGFFPDHDELYWNVTGNGWSFPIESAGASVVLPPGADPSAISLEGYTGPQGSRERDYEASVRQDGLLEFSATRRLNPYEGLTIVAMFPKGLVREPTQAERMQYLMDDNRSLIVGLICLAGLLIFYLWGWNQVGRDPAKGSIAVQYEPPDGSSPAALRYVSRMSFDHEALSAAVINLAVKGALTIEETKPLLGGKTYTLRKRDGKHAALSGEEEQILRILLDGRPSLELNNAHHATLQSAIRSATRALSVAFEKRYFLTNRAYVGVGLALSVASVLLIGFSHSPVKGAMATFISVWLSIWSIGVGFLLSAVFASWKHAMSRTGIAWAGGMAAAAGITVFALPFFIGEVAGLVFLTYATSIRDVLLMGLMVGVNALFFHLMKAYTVTGRRFMDRVEGFKTYLSAVEEDRLNVLAPPEKTPELFEKYLPYALALGVEQRWSEKFTDVLARAGQAAGRSGGYAPSWYSGSSWHPARPAMFASALGSSFASAISSSSTPPGSSSGGGGGGSSGGGGGGGGGGGW